MSNVKAMPRLRFAPMLFGTIVTGALLWLVVKASNVFLLLFIAVLLSLFLRAVADVFEDRGCASRRRSRCSARWSFHLARWSGSSRCWCRHSRNRLAPWRQELPRYMAGLEAQIARLGERIPPLKEYLASGEIQGTHRAVREASAQLRDCCRRCSGCCIWRLTDSR